MKMTVWKDGKTPTSKTKVIDHAKVFVAISPRDALRLIQSLSAQLADENSNRQEFYPEGSRYFSLAIDWDDVDTIEKVKASYNRQLDDLSKAFRRLQEQTYKANEKRLEHVAMRVR